MDIRNMVCWCRRLGQSLRRLFFAFDTPLRRRLWREVYCLAYANYSMTNDGGLVYYALSAQQRRRLNDLHTTLGTRGPTLLSLEFHQRLEGWIGRVTAR